MIDTQVSDDKPDTDEIEDQKSDNEKSLSSDSKPKKVFGRPKKDPGTLPSVARFELQPVDFFNYWRSLTLPQRNNTTVYVYRKYPVVDVKNVGLTLAKARGERIEEDKDAITNIAKLTEPLCNSTTGKITDADIQREVLHMFGVGDYTFGLNDATRKSNKKQVCKTFVSTNRDYVEHPPVLDIGTLVMDDVKNGPYIRYLQARGEKFPGDQEVKIEEEEDLANNEAVKVLSEALVEQSKRQTPLPVAVTPTVVQAPPQESADKLLAKVLEANAHGTEVLFNILEKVHTARAGADNPLTIFTQVGDAFAKISANMGNNGESAKLAELEKQIANLQLTQINALRDEVARLREERAAPQVAATPPKTMIEQLDEAMTLVERFKTMSGGGSKEDADEPIKKVANGLLGTLMGSEMPWWGPILGNVAGMAVQAFISRGMPMPQPPGMPMGGMTGMPNPMPQQPGVPVMQQPLPLQPPQQQPAMPPQQPPMDDPMMKAMSYMNAIAPTLLTHLENNDRTGVDFAQHIIDGYTRKAYDQIRQVGPQTILQAFQWHPQLAEQLKLAPERVAQFVDDFFNYDAIMAQSNAVDETPDSEPVAEAPRRRRPTPPAVPQ